jgi:hypothetical protein
VLGHQSNTLRGSRTCLSYKLGILNILWWEKGGCRGMGLRKMIEKEDGVGAGH